MTQQPAEEWEDMSETQRNEIKARLVAAVETIDRAQYRASLARASRPARRVVIHPAD